LDAEISAIGVSQPWLAVVRAARIELGTAFGAFLQEFLPLICRFHAALSETTVTILDLVQGSELPAPFGGRIAKPLDTDATGKATFYGGFNKIGARKASEIVN